MRGTKENTMKVTNDKDVIIEKMSGYVNAVMSDYFPTFVSKYGEDLYQEGILAVIERLDKYDASKGKPTTYFHIYIVHAMYAYIASQVHNISEHYLQKITQLNRLIQYYECLNGIIDPNKIMKDLKMSKEAYDNASRINEIVYDEFNTPSDYFNNIPASENVEDIIIRKENVKEAAILLNNLEENDKFIVKSRLGLTEKKKNLPDICDTLNFSLYHVKTRYSDSLYRMKKEYLIMQ